MKTAAAIALVSVMLAIITFVRSPEHAGGRQHEWRDHQAPPTPNGSTQAAADSGRDGGWPAWAVVLGTLVGAGILAGGMVYLTRRRPSI